METHSTKQGLLDVTGVVCPDCKDIIYSRAVHDFHHCSCGNTSIDGGFSYLHYGYTGNINDIKTINLKVKATKTQLYQDWNLRLNKFGVIRNG